VSTIAVIGAGSVGRALGRGLARLGHAVTFGVRDPADARHRDLASTATLRDAARHADLVVLAVPAPAVPAALADLDLRAGQVLVDATNAVGQPVPDGHATMGALVASLVADGVEVVKAFDTIGAEHLASGRVAGVPAFLPVAGDPAGVELVVRLATDLGFAAAPLGGRECFGLVEDHARLWIHLAFRCAWGRDFGFAVVGSTGVSSG
jgi:predicted dinucleotide-binding enzyme